MKEGIAVLKPQHAAMVQVFCVCGLMLETLPDGSVICQDVTCPERWKRYRVNVELKPVEQKECRA